MSSSGLRLSIALITRDRPDSLERALASLRAQSIQPFEVIVSDDSGSAHAGRVRQLAGRYGATYCSGPRQGLYANRNWAAEQCLGSHVRTMDDDHLLPGEHLARCFEAVSNDPGSIWTTGETAYLNGELIQFAENANQLGPSGVGEGIRDLDNNWGIADGSTTYPRSVFDRGFRILEDFAFGSSYLEFGAYLYKKGWKCRSIPGAIVEHHATTLSQPDPASILFASLCFNVYFRPNIVRMVRHLAPNWREWRAFPLLFQKAKRRWSTR